ncbi:hypothetical protein CKO12_01240 [Chromatium okenii]|uniref:hypothetical protein n=1 Tax=Chromatium okenii TaxID=61644 RepID=UPI0019031BC3|nr:hypothetical protein [Chromatium okenii]MBK1640523.1 hypothetical protein [Chromatium okenii]
MFHPDPDTMSEFDLVIVLAVQRILEVTEPQDFLRWVRDTVPEVVEFPDHMDALDIRRMATVLGIAVWNATPLPKYGFTLRPLTPPALQGRCHCGSGLRYRDCCANITNLPEMSTEAIWGILLHELSDAQVRDALERKAVPQHLLAMVAERWLEERPRRVLTLLEPLFAGALAELDGRYELAFDMLCTVYDLLDYPRKKDTLIQRICAEGSRELQAVAWQQRCTMLADDREFAQAEEAFAMALRCDPENTNSALLEITLLTSQHKLAVAQERAQFWLHRLRRAGYDEGLLLEFLRLAVTDPQAALLRSTAEMAGLPELTALRDWLRRQCQRPVPVYQAQRLSLRRERGSASKSKHFAHKMMPPLAIAALEMQWHEVLPVGKPVSTQMVLSDEDEELLWMQIDWLDMLLQEPLLADSLEVLDDVATAVEAYPNAEVPWVETVLLWPILERAWAIILRMSPPTDQREFPWLVEANRPALRLLFRRHEFQINHDDAPGAIQTLETMLRLNAHDNHGARAELMNLYLRCGQDAQAAALAQRYPDDLFPQVLYGEVLALYRLGQKAQAQAMLTSAVQQLPRVPTYLTRKRIKQPTLDPFGVSVGGDDQAWLYREEMLEVWAAEPGVLDWLKRFTA